MALDMAPPGRLSLLIVGKSVSPFVKCLTGWADGLQGNAGMYRNVLLAGPCLHFTFWLGRPYTLRASSLGPGRAPVRHFAVPPGPKIPF